MQRNFKLLAWATLANGTCFSMILPLLAPLIRQLHLTEFQGGMIVSAGGNVYGNRIDIDRQE